MDFSARLQTPEAMEVLRALATSPSQARRLLREVRILDKNGELAPVYRTPAHGLPLGESPALAQVLDALRIGRVACEWAGNQQDAEKIAAAMDAARTLAHDGRVSRHCQSQHPDKDVCRAAQRDGVLCADGECDIDEGMRADGAQEANRG